MKPTLTNPPTLPPNRPKTFNGWQKLLQAELDKINNTKVKIDWK